MISDTSGEIARLDYTDGNAAGAGIANVLNDISNATAGGVTFAADYIGEIVANDILSTGDIGSPGAAGSTIITNPPLVPEPSTALLFTLSSCFLACRRKRG